MGNLTDQNFNKLLAVALLTVIIIAGILFAIFKVQVPELVSTSFGIALGFVSHSLGIGTGVAATNDTVAKTAAAQQGINVPHADLVPTPQTDINHGA